MLAPYLHDMLHSNADRQWNDGLRELVPVDVIPTWTGSLNAENKDTAFLKTRKFHSLGGHIKVSSACLLSGIHCFNAASRNFGFFFQAAISAILLSALPLTSSLNKTSVLGCSFAHDLIIVTGAPSRKGTNFESAGTTLPSSKNFPNHLYLSSPVGYSSSWAGTCQDLGPNVQVMWHLTTPTSES